MRRHLTIAVCLAVVLVHGCGNSFEQPRPKVSAEPKVMKDGDLPESVRSFLSAVRRPKRGEFPKPESVVRFLYEQVRKRDFDEATKAFPVVERFERTTFADQARRIKACDPTSTPLPGAQYQRLLVAADGLQTYSRLSAGLLGIDPERVTYFEGDDLDGQVKKLEAKLQPSRLRGLVVKDVKTKKRMSPSSGDRPYFKTLGVTQRAYVEALAACDAREMRWGFITVKMDGNWRIWSSGSAGTTPP